MLGSWLHNPGLYGLARSGRMITVDDLSPEPPTPEHRRDGLARWRRGMPRQTVTGIWFYPLDPRADEIEPYDVAHHLSMICRWGGASSRFYCPTPEQRVLTADLRWVPAGDLRVGDELLGFDEHPTAPGQSGHLRRRWRHARVLTATSVRRPIVRLEFEDGSTIRASAEHPWLTATKQGGNQRWETAGDIATAVTAGRSRMMNRFLSPWQTDESRAGGWLAGIYDGEGHLSFQDRRGVQMGVAQNPGPVLEQIIAEHGRHGFDFSTSPVGSARVQSLQIRGGWYEYARLLGSIRPGRLVAKFVEGLRSGALDKQMNGADGRKLRVVRAWREPDEWVAGLETSTRTYICEGFGAHNSVAEHSVIVSLYVDPEYAREALLHDATEAYLGDIVRPLKGSPEFAGYRTLEARMHEVIAERFNLRTDAAAHRAIKTIDDRVIVDEADALLQHRHAYDDLGPALGSTIAGLSPGAARSMFLMRFAELFPEEISRARGALAGA